MKPNVVKIYFATYKSYDYMKIQTYILSPTFLTFLRVLANPCNPATQKKKLNKLGLNWAKLSSNCNWDLL